MTAREMLEEAEAEIELNRLGFFKVNCSKCLGGMKTEALPIVGVVSWKCSHCKGDGIIWEKRNP